MKPADMNRIFATAAAAALLLGSTSCMKEASDDTFESSKRVFEAWINKYHPDARRVGRGIYILDSIPGTGDKLTDSTTFAFTEYTISELDGDYIETTSEELSKQLGIYDKSYYYGSKIILRKVGSAYAGVEDMLDQMRVGGYLKAAIPSWLINTAVYDTEEQYQKEDAGDHCIYEIRLTDAAVNITDWELDTLKKFSQRYYDGIDTVKKGFYYTVLEEGAADTVAKDTTFYVRYIGKLLNGHVFDTNIEDTAKFYGIYDSSKDYSVPAKIVKGETAADMTMDGSSTISGFAEALFRMKWHEKVATFFYSDLGYGQNGSGNSIPSFAPLHFYIEMEEYTEEE